MKKKLSRIVLNNNYLKHLYNFLRVFTFKYIYRKISKNGIFYQEKEMPMCSIFQPKLLDKTLKLFKPRSILDLGCGTGKSLDYFYNKGIEVFGIEGSKLAIQKSKHPELIKMYNLDNELNLNKKFDLIWSLEFIEHIHPKYVDNLLKTFSNHSNNIVVTAAKPGQGGEGHFNEQPPSYWIEKFKKFGYSFNKEKTRELRKIPEEFSKNILVFERKI